MTRIQQLRKELGYTQVMMQMLTGIDQSDYSKIEQGKRHLSFEQCKQVALSLADYLVLRGIALAESRFTSSGRLCAEVFK